MLQRLSAWWSSTRKRSPSPTARLSLERLESRDLLSVSASLTSGVLSVDGGPERDHIWVRLDQSSSEVIVENFGQTIGSFANAAVTEIVIHGGGGTDYLGIDPNLTQKAILQGGGDGSVLHAGGGPTMLLGGAGNDKLIAGAGADSLNGDGGRNNLYEVTPNDQVTVGVNDRVYNASLPGAQGNVPQETLTAAGAQQLIDRAAAASASTDAIIAVVDRNGRILGVRVESGVSQDIASSAAALTFAIDGAVAEARTAAFFANNQAPLTSRTVQFISQSTITQREVESSPDILDPNSVLRGPGFVAPIGINGHFPPGVDFTPLVDLFDIEATNRDSLLDPGPNGVKGPDSTMLPSRFNVPTQYIPSGQETFAPESYGFVSSIFPDGQARGIGTLPGGIPIYVNGQVVGGIGVFFPGSTGYADAENSVLSSNYDPTKRDRSLEAEYMAFAAVGGSAAAGVPIGTIAGIPAVPGTGLPFGRIDLAGITLPLFGPGGTQGPQTLVAFGQTLGTGNPFDGTAEPVTAGPNPSLYLDGLPVPTGWLVTPHNGVGITAAQVTQMIDQGIQQADQTRAAIRLPMDSQTEMVFAVADEIGAIVGLYRMPDATVFSLAVAVAKARNVAYYNNPSDLQSVDEVSGIPAGVAFTSRTFRYLADPRFPEGIDGTSPGPFSILNDGGVNPQTGLNVGPPLPPSAFQSAQGFNAFNPDSNFHDPNNPLNQNGVVFFPGSSGVYAGTTLIGGLGVSGDGVDQDDVVTAAAINGYAAPTAMRVDQYFVDSVRLPYQKFNRNPEG
jgi:uncharacterized protein GlcG (DUF336 family)